MGYDSEYKSNAPQNRRRARRLYGTVDAVRLRIHLRNREKLMFALPADSNDNLQSGPAGASLRIYSDGR